MTAAAGIAWLALIAMSVADAPAPAPAMAHHAMSHAAAHSKSPVGWSIHWTLMVVAMMWPLYGGTAAAIAAASFRRWRIVTVGAFVAVVTALWLLVGLVARAAYLPVQMAVPAWMWSLAWLAVAIGATRSMWRSRLLRTCRSLRMVAPAGRRAIVTATDAAARSWPRCVALCGPVMIAMAAAHQLPLMIGGSAAVWWEQRHPHTWRDPVPIAILFATAAAVLLTHLWKDVP